MFRLLLNAYKRFRWLTWTTFKWVFLITLPLTFLPSLTGLTSGVYHAFWNKDRITKDGDAWIYHVRDWGASSCSFRQWQDTNNDFHLLRLNTMDWASKLGFVLPNEYSRERMDVPINKFVALDALMMIESPGSQSRPLPPREQWVYITDIAWPDIYREDRAFDAAIQAAYPPSSSLNASRLFFAPCTTTAKFLCGAWSVRKATLLHFSVSDSPPDPAEMEPGLTYNAPLSNLRPVTVRVIEFPLKDAYTGLPANAFPSLEAQVLSIMRGEGLYEQFPIWFEYFQTLRRFEEYIDRFYERKGHFLYYLDKADGWMIDHVADPLGVNDILNNVHMLCLAISNALIEDLVLRPWDFVKVMVLEYLGFPTRADWIFSEAQYDPWGTLMNGLFGGFLQVASEEMKQAEVERQWPGGMVTTGSTSRTTLVVEPSANNSSTR